MVALVTLCLLVSNWLSYMERKQNTIDSVNEKLTGVVKYEFSNIKNWFKEKADAIDALALHYQCWHVSGQLCQCGQNGYRRRRCRNSVGCY